MEQSRDNKRHLVYARPKQVYNCIVCGKIAEGMSSYCRKHKRRQKVTDAERKKVQTELEQLYWALMPNLCKICDCHDRDAQTCTKRGKFYMDCDQQELTIHMGMSFGGSVE